MCVCVCVGGAVSVTVLALLHKAGENNTIHSATSPHKLHSIITFPFIFIFNLLNPLISDECRAVSSLTHGMYFTLLLYLFC